jgi:hypothetical protein
MGSGVGFDTGTSLFTGAGDIVTLDLYSSISGDLADGTSTWSAGNEAGTLGLVEIYFNYDTNIDDFDSYESGDNGSVTISKSGNVYTITFTALDSLDMGIASGTFEGELPIWTD